MKKYFYLCLLLALLGAAGAQAQDHQGHSSHKSFQACLTDLATRAEKNGLKGATIKTAFATIQQRPQVLALDAHQPEFTQTFWQYLNKRVTSTRITAGQILLQSDHALLKRIFDRYRVKPKYLLALWGLESNYGNNIGTTPVLDSLATLACSPRRSQFFAKQLFAALRIIGQGDIGMDGMQGSWAGAIGQTQFLPSVFNRYAVDFDHDGRRDLWNDAADSLASAANYLLALGWKRGQRWGDEVIVPQQHFPWQLAGLNTTKAVAAWRRLGLKAAHDKRLPDGQNKASLLLPEGDRGPAFLIYHNFHIIMKWNTSTSYAIAVGYLADRIAGEDKLKASPPADERSLKRTRLKALQAKLNKLGFDAGKADGILGSKTRAAIRAYQLKAGLKADGYPNSKLFEALSVARQTR